jgi:hypothetical protein
MEVWKTLTTYDKNKKAFDHKRYVCRKDDVWARLEIPVQLLETEKPEEK